MMQKVWKISTDYLGSVPALACIGTFSVVAANTGPAVSGVLISLFLIGVGFYVGKQVNNLFVLSSRLGVQNSEEIKILKKSASQLRAAIAVLVGVAAVNVVNIALGKIFGEDYLLAEVLKTRDIILFRYNEYLFFLGASVGSAILIRLRKFVLSFLLISVGFSWVVFYKSFAEFIALVGVDSLSELNGFDISEASFWISTIVQIFKPSVNFKVLAFYALISALLLWVIKGLLGDGSGSWRNIYAGSGLSLILMGVSSYSVLDGPISLFLDNSRSFSLTKENFSGGQGVPVVADDSEIDILIYIGESTSVMNMGVYGYPRNTTPELARIAREDEGFIQFNNVLATHTHTAWSLLEAFSVGLDESENYLPINYRKRIPVVDLLREAGVNTVLVSNQGSSGTWNQASSIIFGRTERRFSVESKVLGNGDYRLGRPWDHAFFNDHFSKRSRLGEAKKNVIFFHSYAGHGPYLDNIPFEFRGKVDGFLESRPEAMLTGKLSGHIPNIEAYDSAIRYVDFSVSEAIKYVKKRERPSVLIYFSDHGDSVYGGRGHDSTRFVHEMARVPFVVYFNESAKNELSDLYLKYRRLALNNQVSTLAQLPNTILDIAGVAIDDRDGVFANSNKLIGEQMAKFPVAIRDLPNAITYVNVSNQEIAPPEKYGRNFVDVTDYATRYMANSVFDAEGGFSLCYHASNTFAKSLRGRLVASCLEADFVVEDNGEVNIYHPPLPNVGFRGEDFVALAKGKSVWVDAKNLTSRRNCEVLADFLIVNKGSLSSILVEFPTGSHEYSGELADCVGRLKSEGIRTSYYISTEPAVSCSKLLEGGGAFETQEVCSRLSNDVLLAHKSKLYTDISFDFKGFGSIAHMSFLKGYSMNIWNVMPQDLVDISPERFGMIILNNDDPNSP